MGAYKNKFQELQEAFVRDIESEYQIVNSYLRDIQPIKNNKRGLVAKVGNSGTRKKAKK